MRVFFSQFGTYTLQNKLFGKVSGKKSEQYDKKDPMMYNSFEKQYNGQVAPRDV
jgi:hypothetical protein